jgi:hypothetical protein
MYSLQANGLYDSPTPAICGKNRFPWTAPDTRCTRSAICSSRSRSPRWARYNRASSLIVLA